MIKDYKDKARAGHAAKLKAYASDGTESRDMVTNAATHLPAGKGPARKEGGAVHGAGSDSRLDRPCRANGGKVKGKKGTSVHINIMNAKPDAGAPGPGLPPGPLAPPKPPMLAGPPPPMGPPMGGPPGAGGPPPPGLPMRKNGGKAIKMEHSAGGGLGRIEKAKKYGPPLIK